MELVENCNVVAQRIIHNIEQKGLYRFDRMDFKWNPVVSLENGKLYKIRPVILGLEEFFPYILRKSFGIKKRLLPTTFTFLANAYYLMEKNSCNIQKNFSSKELMERCMDEYLSIEESVPWWDYEKELFSDVIIEERNNLRPTMNLHGLTRCNMALINLGLFYSCEEWLDISYQTALHTMKHHMVIEYEDKAAIAYYYNTYPCVINVNTEFAMWLAMLEKFYQSDVSMQCLLRKIVRMIIAEQNVDGSWFYDMNAYRRKRTVPKKGEIDCHHTGTVLYNMITVASYCILEAELQNKLVEAIDRGMAYYIDKFFANPRKVKTHVDLHRPAGPTQYSEAIFAFCEYLKNMQIFSPDIAERVEKILPIALEKNMQFVKKDGSAKSEKVIKWVNIDSIRWGNGPVLEAIMRYLDYVKWKERSVR